MKSLLIKLLVALLFKRALMEWSLLVSIVLISISRSKEVLRTSKVLINRSLDSLLTHLDLWSGARTREMGSDVSTSSLLIILESSIVNTVNLFTGDQGALIAGCTTQNPPLLPGDKTLQSELHLSTLTNLQSAPPTAPR